MKIEMEELVAQETRSGLRLPGVHQPLIHRDDIGSREERRMSSSLVPLLESFAPQDAS